MMRIFNVIVSDGIGRVDFGGRVIKLSNFFSEFPNLIHPEDFSNSANQCESIFTIPNSMPCIFIPNVDKEPRIIIFGLFSPATIA